MKWRIKRGEKPKYRTLQYFGKLVEFGMLNKTMQRTGNAILPVAVVTDYSRQNLKMLQFKKKCRVNAEYKIIGFKIIQKSQLSW